MTTHQIEEGAGTAHLQSVIDVRVDAAAAMAGFAPKFIHDVMAMVHRWNRGAAQAGFPGERIAVAFPDMMKLQGKVEGLALFGARIRLIGSTKALEHLYETNSLIRRMVSSEIAVTDGIRPYVAEGEVGAFVRNRKEEKDLLGSVDRAIRRAERRGKDTSGYLLQRERAEREAAKGRIHVPSKKSLFLRLGEKVLDIKRRDPDDDVTAASGAISVSTYGLSVSETPQYIHLG